MGGVCGDGMGVGGELGLGGGNVGERYMYCSTGFIIVNSLFSSYREFERGKLYITNLIDKMTSRTNFLIIYMHLEMAM